MSIADHVDATLPGLRREAESMMTLSLDAYAPSERTKNADGYDVRGYAPQGGTIGKVQAGTAAGRDPSSREVLVGGVPRPVMHAGLHIPVSAPLPTAGERGVGWEYVVTAVGPVDDPSLVDRRFLVVGVPVKSRATARRLDVVDITGIS